MPVAGKRKRAPDGRPMRLAAQDAADRAVELAFEITRPGRRPQLGKGGTLRYYLSGEVATVLLGSTALGISYIDPSSLPRVTGRDGKIIDRGYSALSDVARATLLKAARREGVMEYVAVSDGYALPNSIRFNGSVGRIVKRDEPGMAQRLSGGRASHEEGLNNVELWHGVVSVTVGGRKFFIAHPLDLFAHSVTDLFRLAEGHETDGTEKERAATAFLILHTALSEHYSVQALLGKASARVAAGPHLQKAVKEHYADFEPYAEISGFTARMARLAEERE